ncbi:MAG: rhodanese-like domain-containing protein [Spirochaetota bacterium]
MKPYSSSFILLGILMSAMIGTGHLYTETLRSISAEEAYDMIHSGSFSGTILDIRTREEFESGHIDGAVHIDYYGEDFRSQIGELDRGTRYIVYCRSGNRSGLVLPLFERLSFSHVYDMAGGILSWNQNGYPVSGQP